MIQGRPLILAPEDIASEYDPNQIRALVDAIRTLEREVLRSQRDVIIAGPEDAAGRKPHLILQAPNGKYFQVEPDAVGNLVTTEVTIATRA